MNTEERPFKNLSNSPNIADRIEALANNPLVPKDYRRLFVKMLLSPREPLSHQAAKLFDLITLRVRFFKPAKINSVMLTLYKIIQ